MDNRRFLKVKIKNLASEARIIRQEARKTSGMARWELNHHRTTVVRWAARNSQLAYAYIRGRRYKDIERTCDFPPNWKDVARMVKKYGDVEFDPAWYQRDAQDRAA